LELQVKTEISPILSKNITWQDVFIMPGPESATIGEIDFNPYVCKLIFACRITCRGRQVPAAISDLPE
jgi:hypothetical protein